MDRKLITILAADLAGFSRLMAEDEEGVIRRLRAAREGVIDPAIMAQAGRFIKTMGDGLLVEFTSPVQAVRAALLIQREMHAREAAEVKAKRLRFSVGINWGDVVIDGDDVLGDAVNVAVRLESVAPVGGLCISRAVFDQTKGRIDAEMTALGPQAVKSMPEPVEVWRVEVEGAEVATPATRHSPTKVLLGMCAGSARNWVRATSWRDLSGEGGNRLRVTAQLIEAATGTHVWAGKWDRTLEDLVDLQHELTHAAVTAVEPELGAHERRLARSRSTKIFRLWSYVRKAGQSCRNSTQKASNWRRVFCKLPLRLMRILRFSERFLQGWQVSGSPLACPINRAQSTRG